MKNQTLLGFSLGKCLDRQSMLSECEIEHFKGWEEYGQLGRPYQQRLYKGGLTQILLGLFLNTLTQLLLLISSGKCQFLTSMKLQQKEFYYAVTLIQVIPDGNYIFKVSNGNTRTRCEICSKLTVKIRNASFWYLYC